METIIKYKTPLIIVGSILLLVALYFIFRNNDADEEKAEVPECPNSFTIYPVGVLAGFVGTTYTSGGGKFFKQVKGEAMGASGQLPPKEITKDEFSTACKTYKIPTT